MGFPRQEYWSGLPFPSPGDLPNPGIEPASPAVADGFFTTEPLGKPKTNRGNHKRIRAIDWNFPDRSAKALIFTKIFIEVLFIIMKS